MPARRGRCCPTSWRATASAVTVFDASHPREKPCGGGVTGKALALLPPSPANDPLPARWVDSCRFESGLGDSVDVPLSRPVAVASRRELDAWLLRRATEAGAVHVAERVVEVDATGRVRTSAGRDERFDLIVGADGAGSLVRRSFRAPTPPARLHMAVGWFARGTAPMLVRFTPDLQGYLWLFPRPDHVGVGIAAPLGACTHAAAPRPARSGGGAPLPRARGRRGGTLRPHHPLADHRPGLDPGDRGRALRLVGDAAALVDPITGEGIYYALRSAIVLADTLRIEGSAARYPERALEDFGRELLKAAALRDRFYAPGFSRRMITFAAREPGHPTTFSATWCSGSRATSA